MSSVSQAKAAPAASTPSASSVLAVEILGFKKFTRGALCGWVDISLQAIGLKLYGLGLFEKEGRRWLKAPSREYESADGERKFAPIAEFVDKAASERFQRAALAALDEFRRGGGGEV